MRVIRDRVPAFSLQRTLEDNVHAELRWSYDDEYWAVHGALGATAADAIEVD